MGRPLEVLPGGELDGQVEVAANPDVALVAAIADAPVPSGIVLADDGRAVGRRVVAQDQLKIAKRLGKDRVDGLAQIPLAVVNRQADADLRHGPSRAPQLSFAQYSSVLATRHGPAGI
jgi:hypothetical protein